MSRKSPAKKVTAEIIVGGEERNLNRLSLVLAASRVPDTMTSWERTWSSSDHLGVTIRVKCVASANDVVPHGIDNDILFGLTNAFIGANCPQDNTLRLTAYQLLVHSALPIGGHSYSAIHSSLTRLRNSTFTIQDSWYDRQEASFQTLSTSLVQNWRVIQRRKAGQEHSDAITAEAMLQVTLDPDLARSIRLGYIRPVDLNILRNLNQPLARTLYRRLEDEKNPIDRPGQSAFQTELVPWAERLGINGRPDTIRRALSAPHEQLIQSGFLAAVNYVGRGKAQTVHYVFGKENQRPAQPEAVAVLTSRRITQGAALKYAAEYGLEAVQRAVKRFDELLASGYQAKSSSGLLVDILRDPEKYQVIDLSEVAKPKPKNAMVPLMEEPITDRNIQTANFVLKKILLPESEKALATDLYLQGAVSAADLASLATVDDPIATVYRWQEQQNEF